MKFTLKQVVVIVVTCYLSIALLLNLKFPEYFNLNGCTPTGRFLNPSSRGSIEKFLFIFAAPSNILYSILWDLRELISLNTLKLQVNKLPPTRLVVDSNFYTCLYCMANALRGNQIIPSNSNEMAEIYRGINAIKRLSLKHGLKVLTYNSLDKELEQARQLILKLERLNINFIKKATLTEELLKLINANLIKKDQVLEAFMGLDQRIMKNFQIVEEIHRENSSFEVDAEDPNNARLPTYLEKALEGSGVEMQVFYQSLEKAFDAGVNGIQEAFSKNIEEASTLKILEFISTHPFFKVSLLRDVYQKIQKTVNREFSVEEIQTEIETLSNDFIARFMVEPLASAATLRDVFNYLSSLVDTSEVADPKLPYNPINYAHIENGATIDEAETTSFTLASPPSVAYQLTNQPMLATNFALQKSKFNPSNALSSQTDEPWFFGLTAQLSVKLATPITPSYFAILSAPPSLEINPTAGIKDVEVWGYTVDGRHLLLSTYSRPIHSAGYDVIKLNVFLETGVYFKSFQLLVKNNHGHPQYSKLYEFAAYGIPMPV